MDIKDKLMETLKETAIPRRSGSEGEKTVAEYIKGWFFRLADDKKKSKDEPDDAVKPEESNLPESGIFSFVSQPFAFSRDTGRVTFGFFALILMFLLFLNFLMLMYFEFPRVRMAMPFLSAAILVYLIFGLGWSPMVEKLLLRRTNQMIETANYLYKIDNKARHNLVFTAHYDSKSGPLSLLERTVLGGMAYFTSAAVALYSMVISIYSMTASSMDARGELTILKINFFVQFLIFWIMFIIALMFFMNTKNESPGALDNASGLSVLLNLAEHFTENPVSNVNLWFTATAAEEEGLVGIVNFLEQNGDQLDKKETYFINLDGVGGGGRLEVVDEFGIPPAATAVELSRWIQAAAEKEGVASSSRWAPPAVGFDSVPPAFRGYQAVSLSHTAFDNQLWATHTKEDTIQKIKPESLNNTFRTLRQTVEELQEKFKTPS